MAEKTQEGQRNKGKRRRYEPPAVEDVPLAPEERLLVACKSGSQFNPACNQACTACRADGS